MSEEFHDDGSTGTQSLLSGRSSVASANTKLDDSSERVLSSKDSGRILLSKLVLALTIVASATGVGLFVYFYTSSLEERKFEKQVCDVYHVMYPNDLIADSLFLSSNRMRRRSFAHPRATRSRLLQPSKTLVGPQRLLRTLGLPTNPSRFSPFPTTKSGLNTCSMFLRPHGLPLSLGSQSKN